LFAEPANLKGRKVYGYRRKLRQFFFVRTKRCMFGGAELPEALKALRRPGRPQRNISLEPGRFPADYEHLGEPAPDSDGAELIF